MSNSNIDNIDAIFLGKHTDKAAEVCDTLYPENKDVCTCWVAKAKQAIRQELLKAELRGFDKAFDSHDYDGLRKYKSELQASLKDGGTK